MPHPIVINPRGFQGKSWDTNLIQTLPYGTARVDRDCRHSQLYLVRNYDEQPLFCGLCFFREGWASEVPAQLHQLHTLTDNGNPQTTGGFMSHLFLVMGLKPPKRDENLRDFRRLRQSPLAREQYTAPSWTMYPVASALWKLMGYQPPLGIVLVKAVGGAPEIKIAADLDTSLFNVSIRMIKAIRTAMGYLPRDNSEEGNDPNGTGGDNESGSPSSGAN